jgi:hypothetical protein
MPTSQADLRCLHCGEVVPERDLAEGWCDSCGKKLPLSYMTEAKRRGSSPDSSPGATPPPGSTRAWAFWTAGVLAALVGAAALLVLS